MSWPPGFCCCHSCRQTDQLLPAYVSPSSVSLLADWAHCYLAGVGGGWVAPPNLLGSQLLWLSMSHPTKSLQGFPFPGLLTKDSRLFIFIYLLIDFLPIPVASSELQTSLVPRSAKWEIKRKSKKLTLCHSLASPLSSLYISKYFYNSWIISKVDLEGKNREKRVYTILS